LAESFVANTVLALAQSFAQVLFNGDVFLSKSWIRYARKNIYHFNKYLSYFHL